MTKYIIIADMEDCGHFRFKDDLILLKKYIPNHLRELKIYEITIDNKNETIFEHIFLKTWLNYDFSHETIMKIFLRFMLKNRYVTKLLKRNPAFNIRNMGFKIRNTEKKDSDLL